MLDSRTLPTIPWILPIMALMPSASWPDFVVRGDRDAGRQVAGAAGHLAHPVVERIGRPDDAAGDDELGHERGTRPPGG